MDELTSLVQVLPVDVLPYASFVILILLVLDRIGVIESIKTRFQRAEEETQTIAQLEEDSRKKNGLIAGLTNEVQMLAESVRSLAGTVEHNTTVMQSNREVLEVRISGIEHRVALIERSR